MFLTWRLYGSLPSTVFFPGGTVSSGQAFVALDRLLDEGRTGPLYLREAALADLVVDAIYYNAEVLAQYVLHAFAVMPNHVHVLLTPKVPLPKVTKSLKGFTARQANILLARTGNPFWQEQVYEREVREDKEFERIRFYIENNPVRAGLVQEAGQYRWSSAGWVKAALPN